MEADNLRALLERYASEEYVRPVEIIPKVTFFQYAMIVITIWFLKLKIDSKNSESSKILSFREKQQV